jgi:stage II sporulation protein AA (anti-sigma F factor antagonist)
MSDITLTFSDLDGAKAPTKLVKFVGQLDETNVEEESVKVYSEIEAEELKNMVFDFSELSYLNSKSIGYLADWQEKVNAKGGKLVIFGAAENIFDILDVVGLTKLIDLVDSVEEAKEAL